jgi:hypothetical protein
MPSPPAAVPPPPCPTHPSRRPRRGRCCPAQWGPAYGGQARCCPRRCPAPGGPEESIRRGPWAGRGRERVSSDRRGWAGPWEGCSDNNRCALRFLGVMPWRSAMTTSLRHSLKLAMPGTSHPRPSPAVPPTHAQTTPSWASLWMTRAWFPPPAPCCPCVSRAAPAVCPHEALCVQCERCVCVCLGL